MDRRIPGYRRRTIAVLLLLGLSATAGCRGLFTTLAYAIRGTDTEAEYDGLKGKKVAIVCRPAASVAFADPTIHRDLARQIGTLLRTNVSKIQVIDQQKIDEWTDEHDYTEFTEVGKAMKADLVVGVDLLSFSLLRGQTLYQGNANTSVVVYDCAKGNKQVFEKQLPQTKYPPNAGIAASEKPVSQFRREFIRVLADQVGRHFYGYDPHADVAQDATAGLD